MEISKVRLTWQDSKHKLPTLKFQFFLRHTHSKRASCLLLPPVLPTRASYHPRPRSSTIKSLHDRNFNLDHVAVFKRVYRNPRARYRSGKSAINYPDSSPRVTQPLRCPFLPSQGWLQARYFLRRCAHARVARIRFKIPRSVYWFSWINT